MLNFTHTVKKAVKHFSALYLIILALLRGHLLIDWNTASYAVRHLEHAKSERQRFGVVLN